MAKTNSLKVAPYIRHVISHMEFDDSLTPKGDNRWNINSYEYKQWRDSGKKIIDFDGYTLMEYTSGRPGEQEVGYSVGAKDTIDWRPNEPFMATLTIRRLERGRSAARFWFEDEDNKTYYPFFGQTLVDMLSASDMIQGRVTGTWIVVKKGSNYGIELVK